jgi:hypothetical protein
MQVQQRRANVVNRGLQLGIRLRSELQDSGEKCQRIHQGRIQGGTAPGTRTAEVNIE